MLIKNKTNQKFISLLILISVLVPTVLFSQPKQTHAFWFSTWLTDVSTTATAVTTATDTAVNTSSLGLQIKDAAKDVAREILKATAKKLLQKMTENTVNWINSGFHGNPLYLTNPESFFKDIVKFEVRKQINLFGYDKLKFPFGKDFALNTINTYQRQLEDNAAYSLSKVIDDPVYLESYRNDFNVGGWNGFLINTQYPQNNYIGFTMKANEDLARKLEGTATTAAGKVQDTLQKGQGFLSPQTCESNPKYNNAKNEFVQPEWTQSKEYQDINKKFNCGNELPGLENMCKKQWESELKWAHEKWLEINSCPGGLTTTTPGSVVSNSIMTAMDSNYKQSELGAALGNSITAVLDTLANHFIHKGLSGLATKIDPPDNPSNWDYYGNTLGSPVLDEANQPWNAGPSRTIVLSEFKKTVSTAITNTILELELINNESATNPGIIQVFGNIWPKTRELDMCLPGPDINWQDRITEELSRNSKKLGEKATDEDGNKAAVAQLALKSLQFATSFFKDWINNQMIDTTKPLALPNSVLYIDTINENEKLSQQADELIQKKQDRTQALARLNAIQSSLTTINTQPAPGTGTEKVLIGLRKQYDAIENIISNTSTILTAQNDLLIAKDKFSNLEKLTKQCEIERKEKGWSNPGGLNSKLSGKSASTSGTELDLFCTQPIKGGYSHGSFIGPNTTVPILPMVNAKNVLDASKFSVWRIVIPVLNFFGSRKVDIEMNCNIIFQANVLDYKGNLPGITTVIQLPEERIGGTTPGPTPGPTPGGGGSCTGGNTQCICVKDISSYDKYGSAVDEAERKAYPNGLPAGTSPRDAQVAVCAAYSGPGGCTPASQEDELIITGVSVPGAEKYVTMSVDFLAGNPYYLWSRTIAACEAGVQ